MFFTALVLSIGLASCKKEDATSKIDPNAKDVPTTPGEANPLVGTPENVAQPAAPVREVPKDGKYPAMKFEKIEHDFGTINDKDKVQTVFKFTNSGEADLIISQATGSCGCTVPDYPKEPIKPGASGEITVSFNPVNKKGAQSKTVTLTTNSATGREVLTIKSNVETTK